MSPLKSQQEGNAALVSEKQVPRPIKIFLVDDHAVVRKGTADMLADDPMFEIVGESDSGNQLEGLLKLKQPDALLLDINLPETSGLDLLKDLRPEFPELKIILFSAYAEIPYVKKALNGKADGYLTKIVTPEELKQLIQRCFTEDTREQPVFSQDLETAYTQMKEKGAGAETLLTAREQEVLVLVAQGLTNRDIADMVCVSVKTVDTHVAKIMKKVGMNNRAQLTAYAYEQGLV